MLAMSGTMVLLGLIFQVFHGCQTHVQAKDASNGSKVNFFFFHIHGFVFFFPHLIPRIQTLSSLIWGVLYVCIELEYVILSFKAQPIFTNVIKPILCA